MSDWTRASNSNGDACVEVRQVGMRVLMRNSEQNTDADQPIINISWQEWMAFLDEIRRTGLANGTLFTGRLASTVPLNSRTTGVSLTFPVDEWHAFADGAAAGEFDFPEPAPTVEEEQQGPPTRRFLLSGLVLAVSCALGYFGSTDGPTWLAWFGGIIAPVALVDLLASWRGRR